MQKIFVAFIVSVIFYFLGNTLFNEQQSILIALVALLVSLWTNEGLPLGVVSLLPIILFPMFGLIDTNDVASNYSKSIIFLFLGGFLVAIAVEKTGLHKVIANKMLSLFPSTPRGIIYSLVITSGVLSSFLSNTTTALILIPLAIFLSDDHNLKVRFTLAVAYGASIGGVMTPIGTPPNLILLGFLETQAIESFGFVEWIIKVAPLAFCMFVIIGYVLSMGIKSFSIHHFHEQKGLTNDQKKVTFILISLIVLLLLNSPMKPFYEGLGLNEKGILLGCGLLLFTPFIKILDWDDSKKIPFEIIFLFGAGFSIAAAFTSTGLAESIADKLLSITDLHPLILMLIIASLVTFTTEVTSNTALISMILPVIYSMSEAAGLNSMLFMMIATICASYAFMLPIATPPNAIAMSYRIITIRTMASYGFVFNLVGITFVVIFAYYFW